jgi:hypothetical protein
MNKTNPAKKKKKNTAIKRQKKSVIMFVGDFVWILPIYSTNKTNHQDITNMIFKHS